MASRFDTAYKAMHSGLKSTKFSDDKSWNKIINRARILVGVNGLDSGSSSLVNDLRKHVLKASLKEGNEATVFYKAAGEKLTGKGPGALIDASLARRLAALKMLRHTYFLKKSGGHKIWVMSLPDSFSDWPHKALRGGILSATNKLIDVSERFSEEDKKNLSHASQEGLKWVHKAMMVVSSTKKAKNFELVARWFADNNSTDEDVTVIAAKLNAGLKKLAMKLKSGCLLYTDSVCHRGDNDLEQSEAFAWGDTVDVVYIENEFFGTRNTLTGMRNWARIIVHELTHRELQTDDHAYEWQGMAPKKIGSAKALTNADSWAWFCADCAGVLTKGEVDSALNK